MGLKSSSRVTAAYCWSWRPSFRTWSWTGSTNSRWLGPVATQLVGGHLRSRARWYQQGFASLGQNLGEYLAEESRTLVGQREAEARFSELDQIKLDLERLEARFERLSRSLDPSDNA